MLVTDEEFKVLTDKCSDLMQNKELKALFDMKRDLYGKTMKEHVAAKGHHHAYVGGLRQHTYEMLKCFVALYETGCIDVNPDYVILAVFYHDLAKVYEYKVTTYTDNNGNITYQDIQTTEYIKLVGHLYGSARILENDLKAINFDQNETNLILHCILAHHGRPEWGAIKEPCTNEAHLIHQLDMISSKCSSMKTLKQA